jgi:hypothetical protein
MSLPHGRRPLRCPSARGKGKHKQESKRIGPIRGNPRAAPVALHGLAQQRPRASELTLTLSRLSLLDLGSRRGFSGGGGEWRDSFRLISLGVGGAAFECPSGGELSAAIRGQVIGVVPVPMRRTRLDGVENFGEKHTGSTQA